MTDHKAAAEAHIVAAIDADRNGHWQTAQFEVKLAQVEAMLATAEQTRVSNFIAATDYWGGEPGSWPLAIREGVGLT